MKSVAALGTLFLTALAALAQEDPRRCEEARLSREIAGYLGRIGTAVVLDALQLSRAQAEKIFETALKAEELRRAYERDMDRILQEQLRAFSAFRAEDLADQGFSPECERAAAQANHREKLRTNRFHLAIIDLEEAVADVLTPAQREYAGALIPSRDLLKAYLEGKKRELSPRLKPFITRLRRMNDAEFRRKKEELVREFRLTNPLRWPLWKIDDPAEFDRKLIEAFEAIRALSEDEVPLRTPALLKKAMPESEADEIRKELKRIRREKYPRCGLLGRTVLSRYGLERLARMLGREIPPPKNEIATGKRTGQGATKTARLDEKERRQIADKIRELRADINLLNLLNGIHLSTHQMQRVLAAARQAAALRDPRPSPERLEAGRRLLAALKEALHLIEAGRPIPNELVVRVLNHGRAFRARPRGRDPRKDTNKLVRELEGLLSDAQKKVLIDYKPCLIPPKNLKDPVRVGQAHDSTAAIRVLKRVRRVPEPLWKRARRKIVDRIVRRSEKAHGSFPKEKRPEVLDEVLKIAEEARALDDADFELRKEELAKRLEFLNLEESLEKELKEAIGATDRGILHQKIRSHLLHPRIAPLLEERMAMLQAAGKPKPTDLDKITPAESCKRQGGCAINRADGGRTR